MAKTDLHRMTAPDETKYEQLIKSIRQYHKIAIAFSGGTDSTFLLHAAVKSLGPENVVALHVRSTLNSALSEEECRMALLRNFPQTVVMQEVEISPMSWHEFVVNDRSRCYYCKIRMYRTLQAVLIGSGCNVLADGTNIDDQREGRPGLRAIHELQVFTPLADVGLTKLEVRCLAQKFGLSNYNLSSNSCLATRIPENIPISQDLLRRIESAEQFLHTRGFSGCRVRPHPLFTIVEVLKDDFNAFVAPLNREQVQAHFFGLQLAPVALSLKGR
jgi:pyridinium-3,5-biscarboxylic acid mononucleotide sulfurtransferase